MSVHTEILAALDDYFRGLYTGDLERLRSVFHPSAVLWGEVRGQPYHKALDDYLEVVRQRQSPAARGEAFHMHPISLEVEGAIASAKVRCPMLGHDYVDFLSLSYLEGSWRIVAKLFTDTSGK